MTRGSGTAEPLESADVQAGSNVTAIFFPVSSMPDPDPGNVLARVTADALQRQADRQRSVWPEDELDEPHEDLDVYLEQVVQRCEAERQQAELRLRKVLQASYMFERKQIQQVDARPGVRRGQRR
jgi:hypothetical protein